MQMHHQKRIPWGLAWSLALVLLLGLAGTALAVEVRGNDTITIGKSEVIDDDLVVSGATVVVDGVINGDLIVAGRDIIVNGTVNGSLVMVGRTLALNGHVSGAVYSAGAVLTVQEQSHVERNLFFAGYSYKAQAGSLIGRDTVAAGYQGVLNGEVKRNLLASFAAFELNGAVRGDVNVFVEQPGTTADTQVWGYVGAQELPPALPPGLRVGSTAQIGGQFRYTSPVEQNGAVQAKPELGIVYSTPALGQPGTMATPATTTTPVNPSVTWLWARLRTFISLLLLGALALWLMPGIFTKVANQVQLQPWLDGAWGVLVGVAGYGGALLASFVLILLVAGLASLTLAGLAVSVFGLGFGVVGLAFTIFFLLGAYASKLVVIYPLSRAFFAQYLPQWTQYRIVPLAVGVLIFVLLHGIPYLGALLDVTVTVIGLGAMWLVFRQRYAKPAAPPLVLAPA